MNAPETAAIIASAAAALSAIAATWSGLLTLRLLRTTNNSLDVVRHQTEEVLRTRIDARAPRVVVRAVSLDGAPSVVIGSDGRGLRRVTETLLALDPTRELVVTGRVRLANEGGITAHVILPSNARIERVGNTTVVLPPGAEIEAQLRVSRSMGVWSNAAAAREPVESLSTFQIDDSFDDGVTDKLALVVRAFAVAPSDDLSHVSTEPETREALGLSSSVVVRPIVRSYRTGTTAEPTLEIEGG